LVLGITMGADKLVDILTPGKVANLEHNKAADEDI
jgi:hypothetical protein